MYDYIVFAEFNDQGSDRGGREFAAPNWWMGMAERRTSRGQLTLTAMLSLDPATLGKTGYRELFQTGEAVDGQPLVDRQHPHDFFMQLAAAWRVPLGAATGFTIAGGPVAEPAIGPIAFMHRASAADNPTAPLSHHTFDSTHVAFGVVTASLDHAPWIVEGSVFNGREPDDNRWDFDFGKLDSWSGRLWFKPTPQWAFQVSSARLTDPEALEPGNIVRTTASGSWTRIQGDNLAALTVGYGRNDTDTGARNAVFIEGARRAGLTGFYTRAEVLQVETNLLLYQTATALDSTAHNWMFAATVGGVRDMRWRTLAIGLGADLTLYGLPDVLKTPPPCESNGCTAPTGYGSMPVSFHVFVRLQPAGAQHRMWNMRLGG